MCFDSEAEPTDVTYAEINQKDKKPKKAQVKGEFNKHVWIYSVMYYALQHDRLCFNGSGALTLLAVA